MKTVLKLKPCKHCKSMFMPSVDLPLANVCSPFCGLDLARKTRESKAAKLAADDRRETKAKLQMMKTRGQWLAEAKTAIQKFRRLEELAKGSGCISCLRSQQEVEGTEGWKPGGAWDGGHYLSKGARPELALEPMNIWLQCKTCNGGSGHYAHKSATVNSGFRLNLIDRIGLEAVEALEADHEPRKYTIDQLKALKSDYTARARELLKARE